MKAKDYSSKKSKGASNAGKKQISKDKIRLGAILVICILVVSTGILLAVNTIRKGDVYGAVLGLIIAATIAAFAVFTYRRGSKDLKEGYPIHDERSRRVIERASAKTFLVSLYILLAIGWLSEDVIIFRDVSQATGIAIGIMALFFVGFWAYYRNKEL